MARDGDPAHVVVAATRASEKARLVRQVMHLRAGGAARDLEALGPSPMMRQLADRIERVAGRSYARPPPHTDYDAYRALS